MSELTDLMTEKKDLLHEMYILSQKQSDIIKDEQFEKLEDVLNEKDNIIEKINNIDVKFQAIRSGKSLEDKNLSDIQSEIKKILINIKTLDDKNNKELLEAMTRVKEGMKDMRQGFRAMKNYSKSDPYQAFASQGGTLFIDQDS